MKAVLFDLDGTLYDYSATLAQWLAGHLRRFELLPAYAAWFVVLSDFGYRSECEVFSLLIEEFQLDLSPDHLSEDFESHVHLVQVMPPHLRSVTRIKKKI